MTNGYNRLIINKSVVFTNGIIPFFFLFDTYNGVSSKIGPSELTFRMFKTYRKHNQTIITGVFKTAVPKLARNVLK